MWGDVDHELRIEPNRLRNARVVNGYALLETFRDSILEWEHRMDMFEDCVGMVITEEPDDDTVQMVFP